MGATVEAGKILLRIDKRRSNPIKTGRGASPCERFKADRW